MNGTMNTILRSLLALACLASLCTCAMGSGLVQVSLSGKIDREQGSIVEMKVTSGSHSLQFSGMVGEGTTVGDLAALFELKLKRSGFSVSRGDVVAVRGPVSLFIDNVEFIAVRMGAGVTATVTSTEELPSSFRALPPRMMSKFGGGSLQAFVTMESQVKGQEPSLEIKDLDVDLPSQGGTSADVASDLSRQGLHAGVTSTKDKDGGWRAMGTDAGAKAVSMSVKLYSDLDWGIEMTLAPSVGAR
ncbi:MAG: hypothetical protein ACJAVJ_000655 [Planctomycetota bacterium]|jgi:hypothetical protein